MFAQRNRKILFLAITSALLSACGSSDDSSSSSDDHDHSDEYGQRLVMAEQTSQDISVYDRDEASVSLVGQAAATAGQLLKSDDGLSAALVTASGVQFISSGLDTEPETDPVFLDALTVTQDDPQMVMTENHFALLQNGVTEFYPAEDLTSASGPEEDFTLVDITQTFPALILDEGESLYAAFYNNQVHLYSDGEILSSHTCTSPSAAMQNDELVLIQCDEALRYVVVDEDDSDVHTAYSGTTFTGETVSGWNSGGDYILLYSTDSNTVSMVYPHGDHTHSSDPGFSLEEGQNICAAALNDEATAVIAVYDDATAEVLDLSDSGLDPASISLSEVDSASFSCDDIQLAAGSSAFMITDNSGGHLYTVDSHDGGAWHLHGSALALSSGIAIQSTVMLEADDDDEDDDDDDHDH
ncbi:hypothetical protein [Oceanobacter sp. 3_MG-2023]|uniref:hypothetical protein n=1 Tax=Oceanobacter sp. 3_MG-2023 TaxID=3062622 RepID=UPI002734F436|nr:hypothetical protein [Oceanobacter sp. 3_MG-2023]MDP2506407.1 hypothetical protein [Oceanobacter sp. 3_MG-2023]